MVQSSLGDVTRLSSFEQLAGATHAIVLIQNDGLVLRDTIYKYLQSCTKQKDLSAGRKVHSLMVSSGLDSVSALGDHLIRLFSSCGRLHEASRVFCKIQKPTIYTWSAIILAHTRLGEAGSVFDFYQKLVEEGIEPSKFIYLSILEVCCCTGAVDRGKLIHDHIIRTGLEIDAIVVSMLVNLYVKHGSLEEASKVFDRSPNKDVVSWGTMISGYTQHGQGIRALEVFEKMQEAGIPPDKVTYSCVLKACGSIGAVGLGKLIHEEAIKSGNESDVVVGNTLIDMYANCGNLKEARHVFDCLLNRNVVSWGTMIVGYVQHAHDIDAFVLFKRMQDEGLYPSKVALLFVLKACCSIRDIEKGQMLHDKIISFGCEVDVVVGSVLVDMYAKCGSLEEAHMVFERLPERNAYSWNAMISGYTSAGFGHFALELFDAMHEESVKPDKATFSCILKACGNIEAISDGRQIHDQVVRLGFQLDVIIENTLVDMYAKCGELVSAKKLFDKSSKKDVGTWGTMIAGYAQHGHGVLALEIFERMQREGFKPDKITFVSVLKACGIAGGMPHGKLVHDQIIRSGFELDVMVGNSLVDMYAKRGNLMEAHKAFQKLAKRNVVSWNAMIVGYVHHGHNLSALALFDEMQQEGLTPDRVTFACILKACSSLGAIAEGKQIHKKLVEDGFQSSMVVGSTLVDMYAKCGSLEEAREVFDQMPNRCLVSWGAMIAGYVLKGNGYEALNLYWKMVSEGMQPDKVTFLCILKACGSMGALGQGKLVHMQVVKSRLDADVAIGSLLVDMYSKFGHLEDARKVFIGMPNRNIVVWNAIVGGYAQQGDWRQARRCLEDIQKQGLRPVGRTYTSFLAACSHAGQVEEGHQSLKTMTAENVVDSTVEHFNCVVDLLGRAGCLSEATKMLQSTPILPSIIGWMSLLTACKTYGQTDLGRACFDQIVGLDSNTAAGYTIMSNIYADAQKWEDVNDIQELRRCAGAWKLPGKAWIEVNNEVYEFLVEDKFHLESEKMPARLKILQMLMRIEGYVPHLDPTATNKEGEGVVDGNSERLAAACG